MNAPLVHPDRLLPADPATRSLARRLYHAVANLPIVSPHGHTDPAWFAHDAPFGNAWSVFLAPDHYVYRMLYSLGVPLERLHIGRDPAEVTEAEARAAWRVFAEHYYAFRGTPTRMWLDHCFAEVFGFSERLSPRNADAYFDRIGAALLTPAFRPRALFDRFRIECLATTESPLDDLAHHDAIARSGWPGRVITAYRPDPVVDPEYEGFRDHLARLSEISGEDAFDWRGYLRAHRRRRADFIRRGATSTDHGHPTARTEALDPAAAERLFRRVVDGTPSAEDADAFRGQMLVEMARMSLDDGLVLQIHPGSFRNHNPRLFARYGRDRGADIPTRTDYVRALRPLLAELGNEARLSVIVFTLDESTYARELAPLAGHYPCLKLGPAWWFHDSPEGMRRFRRQVTETAGFYNTVGFNDDTRAFFSIPARHDVARRIDCGFLAELVMEHRIDEAEAFELAHELSYALARRAYRFDLPAPAAA
jgi:glucuronate isomerase